jgi:hypothetical protein
MRHAMSVRRVHACMCIPYSTITLHIISTVHLLITIYAALLLYLHDVHYLLYAYTGCYGH